ncbi:hypothetical protein GCM10025869_04830 [Homoserinibacter gongjuensis]|uniref:MFS transporter n=1 Tax=Homoserinibacter gongjuensis TaxID=1162968 RepID=A0ABQ6JPR7_9MICO|nr:hypothetical protein GCM10025869_04830 [Homoserinibacter gongjuensis]
MARIIAAQLVARFPGGMISLGFLIHIEKIFDSYGAAGLVLAATSVGQAISGPVTSRWMGRWGMRPVLVLTTVVCAAALSVIALAQLELWAFMLVGLIAGLSYPPVQPAVRTIYPKMVNSRQLTPLFSLDASAQEIIWIAGPVAVTFVATQVSSVIGIFMSVLFLVVGGAWFISSPSSAGCASRAASAASASCSPARPYCSRPSWASCSSARAPRSRHPSSRRSAKRGPSRASSSRSGQSPRLPAVSASATSPSAPGRSPGA